MADGKAGTVGYRGVVQLEVRLGIMIDRGFAWQKQARRLGFSTNTNVAQSELKFFTSKLFRHQW
jgi:hypothetical protein